MARQPSFTRQTLGRAKDALDALRHPERYGKLTADEAAREFNTSVEAMRHVAGRSLHRHKATGEWVYASSRDKGVRTTSILTRAPRGARWVEVEVKGLGQASKAAKFARAVESGRVSRIQGFKGRFITDTSGNRYYFVTDRAEIARLDREGLLRPKRLRFT